MSYYFQYLNKNTLVLVVNLDLFLTQYKKRLVSRINPSLLLKINLRNTWTLQLNNINQMKLYTTDN
jgi:hypothetical protein